MKRTPFLHHRPPLICLLYLLIGRKTGDGEGKSERGREGDRDISVPHSFPYTFSPLGKEEPTLGLPILLPCYCDFSRILMNQLRLAFPF
ncbi:hypothetical protein EI94DRAFT_1723975 [Lactarius quietus]|nr:hypothetical protein EI94DRAFT_1723975 [Lactarius quietus]